MSKKIAQLTKVIYHLNSKSEDHDLEMQDVAEQYEAEIEQILKDTQEKIDFFKVLRCTRLAWACKLDCHSVVPACA